MAEEGISEFENWSIETTQTKECKEKILSKSKGKCTDRKTSQSRV